MSQPPLTLRRWKRVEYDRLVDLGVFEDAIVNLVDRVLEIYRDPAPHAASVYGWRYRSVVTPTPADVAVPLAFPSARISVSDLMP